MVEAVTQWWFALLVLVGAGWAVDSVLQRDEETSLRLETIWLGLIGFTSITYALNLFTGLVGWQMKSVILILMVLGALRLSKFACSRTFHRRRMSLNDIYWAVFLIVTITLLANWSIGSAQQGDSSVYHIGLVDYAAKYPVIPGLANLHSRLGFNSTTYLVSAVFQNGLWGIEGFRLANGFICILVLFEVVIRVRKIVHLGSGDISDYVIIIGINIVVYSAIWIPSTAISSPNPDLPSALLLLIAIAYSSRAFLTGDSWEYGFAFSFAALSFTFRPLTAPLLAYLFVLIAHKIWITRSFHRSTVIIVGVSSFLIFMVVLRSVVTTGYLYYPSQFRIGWLDWAVPKSSAKIDLNAIEAWAKTPAVPYEQVLHSNSWVGGWIARWKQYFLLPSISVLYGGLLLVWALRYNFRKLLIVVPIKLFIAITFLILFWGYSAPDPRFAVGVIAAAIALPASWALMSFGEFKIMKITAAQFLLFFLCCAQFFYIAATPTYPYSTLFRSAAVQFDSGFIPFQGAPTDSVVLKSGLVVQVPSDGDGGGCFRTEMCTIGVNSMNEGLVFRGVDITDGFRIED